MLLVAVAFPAGAAAQTSDEALMGAVLAAEKTKASAAAPQTALTQELEGLRALGDGALPARIPLTALFEINLEDEQAVAARVEVLRKRLSAPATDTESAELRERDRLRLAFLELPAERREALREKDRLSRESAALAIERAAAAEAMVKAENARQAALAEAQASAGAAAREIATAKARLLAQRSELERLRQSWAKARSGQIAEGKALLERYAEVDRGVAIPEATADALYEQLNDDLSQLRRDARSALAALDEPSAVPQSDARSSSSPDAELTALRQEVLAQERDLAEREADQRFSLAAERMDTLATLQVRRVALLPKLSEAMRQQWTGLSRKAWTRVRNEVSHVRLMIRWYPVERRHAVGDLAGQFRDGFTAGRYGMGLLLVMGLLAALMILRARSRALLNALRIRLVAALPAPALANRVDGSLRMVIAIAPELSLLASIYLLFDQALVSIRGLPELATLRALAYAYAWYAVGLAFAYRILLRTVSRYQRVGAALEVKMRESLRLVGRVALGLQVYLILAQAALGQGALYSIAVNLAGVAALLVAWRLIRRWHEEVTQSYLRLYPTGRLAEIVRDSSGRSIGIVFAAAAFVFVAARGLWIWLRDLALGFEQTRKALSYLFRRRLERQSRKQSQTEKHPELPTEMVSAFTEEAASPDLSIPHFPDLDTTLGRARQLAEGGQGGLFALVGERGSGKTTWLMTLERQLPAEVVVTRQELAHRITTEAALCEWLGTVLPVSAAGGVASIAAQLQQGPPRVVLLDLCQNLMLRNVGGLAAYGALLRIAEASAGRVLWILAFARWPFEYLRRLFPHRDVYDQIVSLKSWPESAISGLLEKRLAVAGYTANYDQLTGQLAPASTVAVQGIERQEDNSQRFHRLVWDYADGNPRVALHFFRLALHPQQGSERRVLVRLFPMPSMNALERFKLRTQLLLACLVQHENLTPAEASASLRFPLAECERGFALLLQEDFLVEQDQRYRVSSHWNRAVLRFLQRKKLSLI